MKIKLIGALPRILLNAGLKPGMLFNTEVAENTMIDARKFNWHADGEDIQVVVYPENYIKV